MLLLLVLPYALVWTRAPGTGGVLTAITLSVLVLFYFACVDAKMLHASGQTRLSLSRERIRRSEEAVGVAKIIFGGAAFVLSLIVSLFAWPIGLSLLLALAVLATLDIATRRWPMRLVELALPAGMLAVPFLLLRVFASTMLDGGGVAMLTLAGGLMLAGYVLLCLIRDEQLDRGERRVTTATTLGGEGALLVWVLYVAAAMAMLIGGASAGWWGWGAPAVLPLAGMLVVWMVTLGAVGLATGLWFAAAAITAIVLNVATL
jgi:hypothetical protein